VGNAKKAGAQPAGWAPREDRDYTRGRICTEEALEMAESVEEMLPYLSRERASEQTKSHARSQSYEIASDT